MTPEQRLNQLEVVTSDNTRILDQVASGLANLTTDARREFTDLRTGQATLGAQLTGIADNVDGTNERITSLNRKIDREIGNLRTEINQNFNQLNQKVDLLISMFHGRKPE